MKKIVDYISESIISNSKIGRFANYIVNNYKNIKLYSASFHEGNGYVEPNIELFEKIFDVDALRKKYKDSLHKTIIKPLYFDVPDNAIQLETEYNYVLSLILNNEDNAESIKRSFDGVLQKGVYINIDVNKRRSGGLLFFISFENKNDKYIEFGIILK